MSEEKISQVETASHLRRRLTPVAKSRYEKLTAEMAAIAKGRTAREMKDARDLESLREWIKRKRESLAILEHKKEVEEPPELEDVEIDLSNCADVRLIVTKKGRMFFHVDKGGERDAALNEDGKILGEPEHAAFPGYEEVGDKVVFVAGKVINGKQKYCVVDSESGEGELYDRIVAKGICNGKLRFVGKRADKYYDVLDGVEKELKVPDRTYEIAVSREGIFFQVEQNKKYVLVDEQGKRISGRFDRVDKMAVVGDRLVVSVQGLIFNRCIGANGDTIGGFSGKFYRSLMRGEFLLDPRETSYHAQVGGQVIVTYRKAGYGDNREAVVSEKHGRIGNFVRFLRIFPIGDRAAIVCWRKNGEAVVFDDSGKKIGREYKQIFDVGELGGKIAVSAKLPSDDWVLEREARTSIELPIYGDPEIATNDIVEINGITYFVSGRMNGRKYVCAFDEESHRLFSRPYVDIKLLTAINERLIFAVELHGEWVVVDRNGRELSDKYNEIIQIKPCAGSKFYVFGRDGKKYFRKLCSLS